jgi:DNA-binding GntR family transcriptional regulator
MTKALNKNLTPRSSRKTGGVVSRSISPGLTPAGRLAAKPVKDKAVDKRRFASLAGKAYELIKREIITSALRPGEYINETQLCERIGIGRTPVHQAIGQLHQERFLDVIPRKGIIVRPISLDEYFNLDEARLLLEVGAMRLIPERVTKDEIRLLEQILERGAAARRARDFTQLLLFDRDFHFALADGTHNPVLASMLKTAYERSLRVWFVSSSNMVIEDERDDHEQIVAALKRGEGDAAAKIMREHILSSRVYSMRQG